METYQKINGLYKRYTEGKKKGRFIMGDWAVPEFEYLAGNQWEFTEKVDGTNIRIGLRRINDFMSIEYGGRTDNAQIPEPLLQHLEATFPTKPEWRRSLAEPTFRKRYEHLLHWMQDNDLDKVTLFGEGYGPKIQNGGKYRDDASFVLFDVKIGEFWLDRKNVDDVASKLGIDSVPTIGYGTIQDAIDIVSSGYIFNKDGGIVRYGRNGLDSTWKTQGTFEAEGIVARPVVPLFDRKGDRIITKIKAVDFK